VEVVEHRGVASLGEALAAERDVVCAEPNVAGARRGLQRLGVRLVPSNQFLTDPEAFADWAGSRRRVVMEDFYREQRRRFGVLLTEDGKPEGGRWNFDRENRRPPARDLHAPEPWRPAEDAIDEELRADLDRLDVDMFGHDGPRQFAVTPAEARLALEDFVAHRLAEFGPWQDAMVPGRAQPLPRAPQRPPSTSASCPRWTPCARRRRPTARAARRCRASRASSARSSAGASTCGGCTGCGSSSGRRTTRSAPSLPLPEAYWGAPVGWECLDEVTAGVEADGYAHHIQRLMVLGTIG
jgi:deoxyribodipyrimidine photolyase-related protein